VSIVCAVEAGEQPRTSLQATLGTTTKVNDDVVVYRYTWRRVRACPPRLVTLPLVDLTLLGRSLTGRTNKCIDAYITHPPPPEHSYLPRPTLRCCRRRRRRRRSENLGYPEPPFAPRPCRLENQKQGEAVKASAPWQSGVRDLSGQYV
jgi:hypothetical protein